TAVNLVDYFFVRRGHYAITHLFTAEGIYGAWGLRGLLSYAIGLAVATLAYLLPWRRIDARAEAEAIRDSGAALGLH
uniref:cytosine permease n=1 Tax=Burkholderia gladioli TaxID=28095 RepID=UPI00163E3479